MKGFIKLISSIENCLLYPFHLNSAKKWAKKFGSKTDMHCYACRYLEYDEEIGIFNACFNEKSPYHFTGKNDGISRESGALMPSRCNVYRPANPSLKIILIRFFHGL